MKQSVGASKTTSLITVIVLTKNEEKHLKRLIDSFNGLQAEFCVVDSFSTDKTLDIAHAAGARVYQNPFVNYAAQFQWAIDHSDISTPWVMRMDADEYLTPELAKEISQKLIGVGKEIGGIVVKRRVHFMGRWIRHGGYYPVKLLRIWRNGVGSIEQKWMDEHIVLSSGRIIEFENDLVDDNQNNLTWWTEKHNWYATREAVDLLNKKYQFFKATEIQTRTAQRDEVARKRWLKNNLYARSPLFLRVFAYYAYRYVFRLGFLDGKQGFIWHFLQGLWYRFLVDAKIMQIKWWAHNENITVREVIERKYNFKIDF